MMPSTRGSTRAGNGKRSTALFSKCFDLVSDGLLITEAGPLDAPGPRIVFVNKVFERMTGYSRDAILGQTPRVLQGPRTNRAELQRIRIALAEGQPVGAELVNYKQSGEEFLVEMDIVPIGDGKGRPTHWVSTQRDVTQRRKDEAEAHVREARRFETLSSGVAHDFNNVIAAILGNVALSAADMQAGQMPLASLEQIRIASLRGRSVVAKFLAHGQPRQETAVAQPLEPVVREATDLLRATLPAGVKLDVTHAAEPLWVLGNAAQLVQVLLNLGANALQALGGQPGRIHFALEGTGERSSGAAPSARRYASIQVSDDGCGMDAGTQARIFEPYFTTKGAGHGSGLGLSVARGIVAAHGGAIAVDSAVGRGTRMRLSLPLIAEAAAPSNPKPVGAIGSGEHVLVVDDDEVVSAMMEAMLKHWGFRVTSLLDPLEAVRLFRSSPNQFDAVVTDLNMPNISGLQLAREMLAVRHDMPVFLTSGNMSHDLDIAASRAGIAAVFPKEYAVEQLGPLLQNALKRLSAPV